LVFLIHTELRCTVNHTSDIQYSVAQVTRIKCIKDKLIQFNFNDVFVLYYGHRHVSTTHVAILRVVSLRTRIRIKLKFARITPRYQNTTQFLLWIHGWIMKL